VQAMPTPINPASLGQPDLHRWPAPGQGGGRADRAPVWHARHGARGQRQRADRVEAGV